MVSKKHDVNLKNTLSVQETLELISKDVVTVCDDTYQRFKESDAVPPYYDEEKFKKGQQFYHKHVHSMFYGKLLGLLTVLSTPTLSQILVFTNMSNNSFTAYKRYLATVFHMCVWYEGNFKPGSILWQSVSTVKSLHNSASKRFCTAKGYRILQRDMGITQFGFMGYAIIRPEQIGIHYATREELESFIHLWRVIGYIIGMDDKYNICRDTLEETKEVCEGLINNIFIQNIRNPSSDYLMLIEALTSGMWTMQPFLNYNVFRRQLHSLLCTNNNNNIGLPSDNLYHVGINDDLVQLQLAHK
ncbi:hypothetical protein FQA39_LY09891 [Lamprigera yunnana]|nr:hypothetical protein FQA39_LY09891 [Lamprigera yunnana]